MKRGIQCEIMIQSCPLEPHGDRPVDTIDTREWSIVLANIYIYIA